jgi:hypothetical protein
VITIARKKIIMDYLNYKIPDDVKNIINIEFIVGNYTVPIRKLLDNTVEFATQADLFDDVDFKNKLSCIIGFDVTFILLEKSELLELIGFNYSFNCSDEDCLHTDDEIEVSRLEYIKQWAGDTEEINSLKEQYQNPVGKHEPLDRLYMIAYTFQEFVQTHPVVLLDSNLYEKAFTINEKMAELYQLLGESGAE